jgi:hypothetical protein
VKTSPGNRGDADFFGPACSSSWNGVAMRNRDVAVLHSLAALWVIFWLWCYWRAEHK